MANPLSCDRCGAIHDPDSDAVEGRVCSACGGNLTEFRDWSPPEPKTAPQGTPMPCPSCSSPNTLRRYSWKSFATASGTSVGIALGIAFGCLMAMPMPTYATVQGPSGEVEGFTSVESPKAQMLTVVASLAVVVAVIRIVYLFLSALLGQDRCEACGHRWRAQ